MKHRRVLAFPLRSHQNPPTMSTAPSVDQLVGAFHLATPTSRRAALIMLQRPELAESFEALRGEMADRSTSKG